MKNSSAYLNRRIRAKRKKRKTILSGLEHARIIMFAGMFITIYPDILVGKIFSPQKRSNPKIHSIQTTLRGRNLGRPKLALTKVSWLKSQHAST